MRGLDFALIYCNPSSGNSSGTSDQGLGINREETAARDHCFLWTLVDDDYFARPGDASTNISLRCPEWLRSRVLTRSVRFTIQQWVYNCY